MCKYIYVINKLKSGSNKFGPCEVCGKNTSKSFIQTKYEQYYSKNKKKNSYIHRGCKFGHKKYLESIQT
ncbi:MAG: hypothetical protein ACOCP4_00790 [Candidatus Woesearchaeota archaeon]